MKNNKKKKGFTLPELIAVLVILVVIALIAINTIKGVLDKANKTIDEDKEKQILNAAEKWAIENSDKFDDNDGERIQIGLDVVFVVDVSGSMKESMGSISRAEGSVNAINGALKVLKNNPKNNVGFVFYSGQRISDRNLQTTQGSAIVSEIPLTAIENISYLNFEKTSNNQYIIDSKGKWIKIDGGTYTSLGVRKAASLLKRKDDTSRIPVIILLTDGSASWGTDAAKSIADFEKIENLTSKFGTGAELEKVTFRKTNIDGHTNITFVNGSNLFYNLEHWKDDNCTKIIETNGHTKKVTNYNSCDNPEYVFNFSINPRKDIPYDSAEKFINGVTYYYEAWYKSEVRSNEENSNDLRDITWDLTRTSYLAKELMKSRYGVSTPYFYTIGLGVTRSSGVFMLNPTSDNLANLKNDVLLEATYDNMITKTGYNYPTKAFTGNMSEEDLNTIFINIATEVTKATEVKSLCLTIDDLYNDGYLSTKDFKIANSDNISEYIIVTTNPDTNQYRFKFASDTEFMDERIVEKKITEKQWCIEYIKNRDNK